MQHVPDVKVEISEKILRQPVHLLMQTLVLDPFILNILPFSLRRTALYLIAIAIFAWPLSVFISNRLNAIFQDAPPSTPTPRSRPKLA